MIYDVCHETRISYAVPVTDARFNLRLQPVAWPGQSVSNIQLEIDPLPFRRADRPGPYHLTTTRLEFDTQLASLEIVSRFRAEITAREYRGPGPDVAELRRLAIASRDMSVLSPAPYLFPSRIAVDNPAVGKWAEQDFAPDRPVLDLAQALAARVHGEFTYKPGSTDSTTEPVDAFTQRHGVCQDFAHVMIMGLRWLGIPAAYASGYLRTIPPPGKKRLVGADAMHAWVTAWCGEELGWVGIDPTNNCLAQADHIQIAMGRDYADVAPIDGTFVGAAPQSMVSAVDVTVAGEQLAAG